ncbi:hypothetical protein FGF01_01920 [Aeromonas salmonicida subsp. achromogenes]|uniref:Uncharacterized protein n=2 Tax=Aeromonadaceae TaxID=84642 RepID=A0A2T4N3G3_AERVE|nr:MULTISPECIES: hypothetical protein [Aeromonas]AMQ43680.1 hypothetical protein AMS64_15675 [Aeromonas veronii]MCV3284542.1 hypothetical protein [Aeromonas veronii]MCX0444656.1 hypothetical protein [Aeromonas veronii]PTH81382.1 hypothetical protein DAA48_09560 [Aeromonas veronii]RDE59300.1 hypothetical protein DV708_22690 [Aeromonas veronii]
MMNTLQASAAERALAEMRQAIYHANCRVAKYWGALNQDQREAICYNAKLPISLAKPEFPLGECDRESLCLAMRRLGYQHLFHGAVTLEEWRSGLIPPPEEKPEVSRSAERLAQSKGLLMTLVNNPQTANCGQEKTPITGAANT